MKRIYFYVLAVIGVFLFSSCENKTDLATKLYGELDLKAAPNTLTEKEQQAGWQLLFDGKTTDGWHGYNMQGIPDVWTVSDGCIAINTEGGKESQDIITNGIYKNFALSLEFKLAQGSNSGIIFQVKEDTIYHYPYETGPEFQLIDDIGWTDGKLEDWQMCGANYAMYPPTSHPSKPAGEWNHLFLVVNGNQVTQMINGVEVAKYVKYSDDWVKRRNAGKWKDYPDYGKFDEGNISLQNHGSNLYFKNIKIKLL